MIRLLAAPALIVAFAVTGCSVAKEGGVADDAPLDIYLSVPLSGPRAPEGKKIETEMRGALEAAGGEADSHPIVLTVLDATGGDGAIDDATVGANARRATEDADSVAYYGEVVPPATGISAPITEKASLAQVILSPRPQGLDSDNVIGTGQGLDIEPAGLVQRLIEAIEATQTEEATRSAILDELRTGGN